MLTGLGLTDPDSKVVVKMPPMIFRFSSAAGSKFKCELDDKAIEDGCMTDDSGDSLDGTYTVPNDIEAGKDGTVHTFRVSVCSDSGDCSDWSTYKWRVQDEVTPAQLKDKLDTYRSAMELRRNETRMTNLIGESRYASGFKKVTQCGQKIPKGWIGTCTTGNKIGEVKLRLTSDQCSVDPGTQLPMIDIDGQLRECDEGQGMPLGNNLTVKDAYRIPSLPGGTQTDLLVSFHQEGDGDARLNFDFDCVNPQAFRSIIRNIYIWKADRYLAYMSQPNDPGSIPSPSYVLTPASQTNVKIGSEDSFKPGFAQGSFAKATIGSSGESIGKIIPGETATKLAKGDYIMVINLANPADGEPSPEVSRWGVTAALQDVIDSDNSPSRVWTNHFTLTTTHSLTKVSQTRASG